MSGSMLAADSAITLSSRHSTSTPRCSRSSTIASTSRMRGMLRRTTSSRVSREAASTGRAAFLLPAGTTVPERGYPPSMRNFDMAAGSVPKGCHPEPVRRASFATLVIAFCCVFAPSAVAAPWSFIVAPTEQLGVPGYPAGTEITPEGYLYTGSAEIAFGYGPRYRPWNVPIRRLQDGRYPIISSDAGSGHVGYTLTVFTQIAGGQPV